MLSFGVSGRRRRRRRRRARTSFETRRRNLRTVRTNVLNLHVLLVIIEKKKIMKTSSENRTSGLFDGPAGSEMLFLPNLTYI